ncbi:MAG: 2-isopropylmalate synthase [bacterium]|nr:2-isopropylmalate synthase [bacterium]
MLKNPAQKYRPVLAFDFPERTWPAKKLTRPPVWMSTDLRDGNQALFEPMSIATKLEFFKTIVGIGFKEVEIGFPSASEIEFEFTRLLIEGGHIPDDVSIEVLTQARESLIRRTFESLRGARRAIVHLYNATSPVFRRDVFSKSADEVRELAVEHARLIRELAAAQPETQWVFQYSPETFSATEPEVALDVCNAVIAEWNATPQHKVIINLPATVEISTPNQYADQIEWMHTHLARRECVVLSVHPHNDRGTAVAAAELAMLAGADRVEGCLFGNGERTGNVDLVTLAMNFYAQGIHPGLDFSQIDKIAAQVERATRIPLHPRHPYAGSLVYTAFSGSHQDAIRKGFAVVRKNEFWEVPYLPIDPADVGRSYEAIIRVNSQSGKGGIAHLMETAHGITLPVAELPAFSRIVQAVADDSGLEINAEKIWEIFCATYEKSAPMTLLLQEQSGQGRHIKITLKRDDATITCEGEGSGPIEAFMNAIAMPVRLRHFEERSLGEDAHAEAMALVTLEDNASGALVMGMGRDRNSGTAALRAIVSACNRIGEVRSMRSEKMLEMSAP